MVKSHHRLIDLFKGTVIPIATGNRILGYLFVFECLGQFALIRIDMWVKVKQIHSKM